MTREGLRPGEVAAKALLGIDLRAAEPQARATYAKLFPNSPAWETIGFGNPFQFKYWILDQPGTTDDVATQETLMETAIRRFKTIWGGEGNLSVLTGLSDTTRRSQRHERLLSRLSFPRHLGRFGMTMTFDRTVAYEPEQYDMIPNRPTEQQLREAGLLKKHETVSGYGRQTVGVIPEGYVMQTEGVQKLADIATGGIYGQMEDRMISFAAVVDSRTQRPKGLVFF